MKFSIKYQLSPRTEGDRLTENVPIRLRVSFAGIRVDLRSGYVIDAEKWDNSLLSYIWGGTYPAPLMLL